MQLFIGKGFIGMSTNNNQEKDIIQITVPKGKLNEYEKIAGRNRMKLDSFICKLLDQEIDSKEYIEDYCELPFIDKGSKDNYAIRFCAIKYFSNDKIKFRISFLDSSCKEILYSCNLILDRFEIMNEQNIIKKDIAMQYAKKELSRNAQKVFEYEKAFDVFFNSFDQDIF
jgi:hypothetical protein